ncbi:carboxylesterase/lipase family protein [Nonomuraea spiralis]|uniref:Carboxylic ester hydrolase n=1 Tax=Nonomuraea spiralis TaxID=46182 RepID=A0ABV5IGH1_9ACTN|nr:carboxylesterase family protein [Nonomuraea spiralis]GGT38882.1 carboxylic ester hydrolase [Nonomuraea spiralis]
MTGPTRAAAALLAALASLSALTAGALPAQADRLTAPAAMTTSGEVRGTEKDGVHRFRNIPYAAPPVGERRWQPPQPASSWTGARDATEAGPACLQPEAPDMPKGTPQSEDCLTLEVSTPARPGKGRPVMVWVPGGGFITGAGSIYDPTRLVEAGDIVVVTVNYRLGVFGFFAHPELGEVSNFGLQDQVAALRWVRANIAAFGGDPGKVTLAGASAGAMSACTLMTSPAARGLFQRAIVQSGSCRTRHPAGAMGAGMPAISSWHPLSTVQGAGRALAGQLACADVACLRRKSAGELLPYTAGFPLAAYGTSLVPQEPAKVFAAGGQAAVPLLQGNVRDEHVEFTLAVYPEGITAGQYPAMLRTAFASAAPRIARRYPLRGHPSPTAAISRVFSDSGWICPSWKSGREHARKAATYAYVFADPSAPTPSGEPLPAHVRPATAHGAETFYLFDFPDAPGLSAEQRRLADRLVGYWTRFVRTGDPNGVGNTRWPRLGAADRALELAPEAVRPINLKNAYHCGLWP